MDVDNITYDPSDLEINEKTIGSGTFGEVYLAKSKTDGHQYALKYLRVFDASFQTQFFRESLIMNTLNYPAIVKFHGINIQDSDDPNIFRPSILTEYVPNGSLKSTIKKWKSTKPAAYWTPTCRYKTLLGVAYGMRYLHRNHVIHRDLKPDNILLDASYEPCICDFGTSRYISDEETAEMTKRVGTPLYMAPELMDLDGARYTGAVDVYSFSFIAYEVITGESLFKDTSNLRKRIRDGIRPNLELGSISAKARDMLEHCWDGNPEKRFSFEKICDLLSNDFSYINEEVNEAEVRDYVARLESAQKKEPFQTYPSENNQTYLKFLGSLISKIDNFTEMKTENIFYLAFVATSCITRASWETSTS